jgi:hypothetical protein
LKAQIEKFKDTYGCYPESVHVDKIYRTRENRAWCKERGIRISGIPLGRPPKNQSAELKKQAKLDEAFRNRIGPVTLQLSPSRHFLITCRPNVVSAP